jgi:adenylate cyclase
VDRQIAAVMNAVLDGGASVVGFDLISPTSVERHVRGFDREFLKALNRASRKRQVALAKIQHQLKPISPFQGYSFAVGHYKNIRPANVFEDPDGFIRRVPLLFRSLGQDGVERTDPSIALELAERRLGIRPEIGQGRHVRLAGYDVPDS